MEPILISGDVPRATASSRNSRLCGSSCANFCIQMFANIRIHSLHICRFCKVQNFAFKCMRILTARIFEFMKTVDYVFHMGIWLQFHQLYFQTNILMSCFTNVLPEGWNSSFKSSFWNSSSVWNYRWWSCSQIPM